MVQNKAVFSKTVFSIVLILSFLLSASEDSRAQCEKYVYTETYKIPAKGDTWLNIKADFANPRGSGAENEYLAELHYGISDRFTIGVTGAFEHQNQKISYEESEVGIRYWLIRNKSFNTTLHLSYEIPEDASDGGEAEMGIFLSKDFNRWNITGNLNLEKEFKKGPEQSPVEMTFKIAASYQSGKTTQIGVEYLNEPVEQKQNLVPGIYQKLSESCHLNLGYSFSLNQSGQDNKIRTVLSIKF